MAGAMPASFTIPLSPAVIWTPLDVRRSDLASERGDRFLRVLGRLAPAADLAQARAGLDELAGRLAVDHPATNGALLANLDSSQPLGSIQAMTAIVDDVLAGRRLNTVLLLVAAAASYVPARRAARIDPMEVLRGE